MRRLLPLALHLAGEEAEVVDRDIGERVRPVFEHGLRLRLRRFEVGAAVGGDAVVEDVVVAALDHVDRVDLHVAQMRDRARHRLRPGAERLGDVQPLRIDPEARARSGEISAGAGVARRRVGFGLRVTAGRRIGSGDARCVGVYQPVRSTPSGNRRTMPPRGARS